MTSADIPEPPRSETEFISGLHAIGDERYHHRHPFHLLMHEGKLTRGQLQTWALNRYYYQRHIPIKDAAILARSKDLTFRVAWLSREQATRGEGILPGTRFAVQAYLHLVSQRSHLEAVASSLTELFSHKLIALRMDRMRLHYPWLVPALDYFQGRLTQAPEDAEYALAYCVKHARTREQQDLAYAALRAKCDILWAQLDALYFAYVEPGWPPPGAFRPAKGTE